MPRSRPFLAGLAVAVVAVLATAAPASAHDKLLSSDPAPDQALEEAPSTVVLTFSADVLDMGAAVVVADADGTDWVSEPPTIDGPTVTAALDPGMSDAGYEIRWRVVSSDGHPISGVVPFTVGDGAPADDGAHDADPDPDGAAADAAAPEAASAPDTGTDTDTRSSTQTQTAQEDEGPLRAVLVGAGGAAVAVVLLVLVQLLRRRGTASGAGSSGTDPHEPDEQ
jgi:methionine-rich copper-binding protein CopC